MELNERVQTSPQPAITVSTIDHRKSPLPKIKDTSEDTEMDQESITVEKSIISTTSKISKQTPKASKESSSLVEKGSLPVSLSMPLDDVESLNRNNNRRTSTAATMELLSLKDQEIQHLTKKLNVLEGQLAAGRSHTKFR